MHVTLENTIQPAKFDCTLLVCPDSHSDLCRFVDITDSSGYGYDYNPCNIFKAKHCDNKDVFVCF